MTAAHTNNLGRDLATADGLAELALFISGDQVSVLKWQVFLLLPKASAAEERRRIEQQAGRSWCDDALAKTEMA